MSAITSYTRATNRDSGEDVRAAWVDSFRYSETAAFSFVAWLIVSSLLRGRVRGRGGGG
jgi:hypothetical protein